MRHVRSAARGEFDDAGRMLVAVLAAPAVFALVIACVREPMRVALPIFAALIPFGGALSIGSSRYASLSSLAGLLLAVTLVLQFITSRRSAPRITPAVPVWLFFLAVAVATVLWSEERWRTANAIIVLASLVLVYVFTVMSHADRTVIRRTENGLLIGAAVAVGYGLMQLLFLGGLPTDNPGAGITEGGRFGNGLLGPNIQSVALILPLTIALSRTFTRRGTPIAWHRRLCRSVRLRHSPDCLSHRDARCRRRHLHPGLRGLEEGTQQCPGLSRRRGRRGWPGMGLPARRGGEPDLRDSILLVRAHRHLEGRGCGMQRTLRDRCRPREVR